MWTPIGELKATKTVSLYHGGLESTEIQKKMPWFDTHIFWLGTPLGSQKCPNGNIPSMYWRENTIFQIYVLKIDQNLQEKEVFCIQM